jgi:NAD(P)-dependent dehydrogenase (short-subunit alcohol dehydrogenase family)
MKQAALVTGSSRGIGRGIALALARSGFDVALHGRTKSDALEKTRREVEALGVRATSVAGDISDISGHSALLDEAEAALGPLTTLVNNAGVGPLKRADMLESIPESFDHCIATNVKAVYFLSQDFANRLLARERSTQLTYSITVISSINAVMASYDKADYCVSKAAVAMVAKVLAQRLAPQGIQVFDVQPGIIETDLSQPVLTKYQKQIEEKGITLIPRFGQAEEVGQVVATAARGDLPYCVGQVLRPDGGLTLQRL